MRRLLVFLLCLSIFSQITFAGDPPHDGRVTSPSAHPSPQPLPNCEAKPITDDEFKEILRNAYRPLIRAFNRQVYFYHYGWRTPRPKASVVENGYDDSTPIPADGTTDDFTGPVGTNPLVDVDGHPLGLAERYFRRKTGARALARHSSSYGPGLYTGVDPIGGLYYSQGLLLRVGVPAGTKFVDIRGLNKRLPLTAEDSQALQCKLQSWRTEHLLMGGASSVHLDDILSSPQSRRLDGEVLREMEIAAIHPEDMMLFVNPDAASKLDLAIIVPALEREPSAEKRKIYGEVLRFFDAFDFSDESNPLFNNDASKSVLLPKFWNSYRSWAGTLRGLPKTTDWTAYQREQAEKWKDPEIRYRKLTSSIFGASKEYPEEYEPWIRK